MCPGGRDRSPDLSQRKASSGLRSLPQPSTATVRLCKCNRWGALDHESPEVAGLADGKVAGSLVLDRRVVPDQDVVRAPAVRVTGSVLLGMVLELLQERSSVWDGHSFDLLGPIQIA